MPITARRGTGRGRGRGRGRGKGSGRGRGRPRKNDVAAEVIAIDDDDDEQKDEVTAQQNHANELQTDTGKEPASSDVESVMAAEHGSEGSVEPVSSGDEEEMERRAEEQKKRAARATRSVTTRANAKAKDPEASQDTETKTSPAHAIDKMPDPAPRKRRCVTISSSREPDAAGKDTVQSPAPSARKRQTKRVESETIEVESIEPKDVEEVPKPSKPASTRRSGRKGKWDEDKLVTDPKSPLVNVDLVKLLANPLAWTCLTEAEKREILSLLPENIHPEYSAHAHELEYIIPPLPDSFLRYSNAWRDSVRQFQSDLELGRYTAKWQRDAAEASRQRALGMFDDFKEKQFEQFWGQKQKLDRSLVAGESSKIKLETLVRAGVVKVGDVWKYSRIIKKEKHGTKAGEEVFVEKECKVIGVHDGALDFIIPQGRKVLLSQTAKDFVEAQPEHEKTEAALAEAQVLTASQQSTRNQSGSPEPSSDNASDDEYAPARRLRTRAVKNNNPNLSGITKTANREITSRTIETGEIIYDNITTPNQLGNRILEVDGRIKEPPNGNAWKDYRCFRNNQDMGSLWEVRHLWYTRTH